MKACPSCGRLYPDDSGYCQSDGTQLTPVSETSPAAADDPRVGQVLGERYKVFRVVADGGMGRVYEGFDCQVERHVALKILHQEVVQDEVSVERFKREWEVSRLVPHRHIVDVIDFFSIPDGSYVLVMEFLVGEELRATMKREEVLPAGRVVRMLSQLALALDSAHQQKLVHRDLKPENIFLCQSKEGDSVKVLDFGSVKNRARNVKQLTIMGTTIGSPYYMSPEQAQALETLDHRADVWSLAAVCYECLTGRVPFPGDNGPSILIQILTKPARAPSELTVGLAHTVPPSVDRVLLRALSKAIVARTHSVGKLADELGTAYGLTGEHATWAVTPEAELNATISQAMPALLADVGPRKPAAEATLDRFFGEESGLGETSGAASRTPHIPSSRAPSPAGVPSEEIVLPVRPVRAGFYGLIVLAFGLLACLVYWLTR